MRLVVDASVAIKWLVEEEHSTAEKQRIEARYCSPSLHSLAPLQCSRFKVAFICDMPADSIEVGRDEPPSVTHLIYPDLRSG